MIPLSSGRLLIVLGGRDAGRLRRTVAALALIPSTVAMSRGNSKRHLSTLPQVVRQRQTWAYLEVIG